MLSFSQLSERKTKVKINPKKNEIIEGSGDVKKNHGEDCDCSKCDKKRRKDDVKDGPDVANEGYDKPDEKLKTDRNMFSIPKGEQDAAKERLKAKAAAKRKAKTQKEEAYVSQEEVSEEGYQEGYETETDLTEALPGSVGAKAGSTYSSKKDFKQAYRANPGSFKSPLPGGMGSYMNSVKPSARNSYTSQRPSMGMPVGIQKSMFNSPLGQKLGGGGNFWKSTMKANNVNISKKSAGGKVKKEETEIPFLTFDQYQHAQTLDEEQLNEFLQGLFGGGKKPAGGSAPGGSSSGQQMPSHAGLASKLGQRRQMMNQMMGKQDTKVLGYSKGGKVKKEEVEGVDEAVSKIASMKLKPNQGSRSMAGRAGMAGSPSAPSSAKPNPLSAAIQKPMSPGAGNNAMSMKPSTYSARGQDGRAGGFTGNVATSIQKTFAPAMKNKSMLSRMNVPTPKKESADIKSFRHFCQDPENVNELFGLFGGSKKKEAPKTQSAPPPTPSAMSNMKPSIDVSASAVKDSGSNAPKGASASNLPLSSKSSPAKKSIDMKPEKKTKSFKEAVHQFDERTRYAKETGKDYTTGNPSEKGGEGRSEVGKSMQKMMRPTGGAMSSRKKAIQPQGKKKEKGAKPKFKTEPTPVDKIKRKLSDKRAPKKDPYGYGQGRYQGD